MPPAQPEAHELARQKVAREFNEDEIRLRMNAWDLSRDEAQAICAMSAREGITCEEARSRIDLARGGPSGTYPVARPTARGKVPTTPEEQVQAVRAYQARQRAAAQEAALAPIKRRIKRNRNLMRLGLIILAIGLALTLFGMMHHSSAPQRTTVCVLDPDGNVICTTP